MKIFSQQQLKDWDKYTIQEQHILSLDLMEMAANACLKWILEHFQSNEFRIICGPGDNGGDGLALARLLDDRKHSVKVYRIKSERYSADNISNLEKLKLTNVEMIENIDTFFDSFTVNTVLMDAVFGTGLNKPLTGMALKIIQKANLISCHKISIDIPSGLSSDNLLPAFSTAFKATYTLTFQAPKLAFMYPKNEAYVGEFEILDIGLDPTFTINTPSSYCYLQMEDLDFIKKRSKFSHKGTFGHSLLIAGSAGKMGAAILAAKACLKSGSGLLTAYTPKFGELILQISVPEAMSKTHEEEINFSNYNSIGIGPGLGITPSTKNLVASLMANYHQPIVFDADALTILNLNNALNAIPKGSILTPHPKEFDRIFGASASRADQIQKGLEFVDKHTCYIVLKGAHTAILCPGGQVYFNATGNPAMAKGGSGDVLTGMITAFLAQGYSSEHAAILGVFLHGMAADIALDATSEISMMPSDLIANIGNAWRKITKKVGV